MAGASWLVFGDRIMVSRTLGGRRGRRVGAAKWILTVKVAVRRQDGSVGTGWDYIDPFMDLADHRSEFWFEAFLRRNHLLPLDAVVSELVPHIAEEGGRCSGFSLRSQDRGGQEAERRFTITAIRHVARRIALSVEPRCAASHAYELHARRVAEGRPRAEPKSDGPFRVSAAETPLRYLEVPIGELVDGAQRVGEHAETMDVSTDAPVFFPKAVLDRCETYSRRGAGENPPIETGAALLGCPVRCPETGEFGVVITECLKLWDVESRAARLTFSGVTWACIQQVIRRRQEVCPAERFIGQCHGHPFDRVLFVETPPCEHCADTAHPCSRHNAAPSPDDRDWHRAVFGGRLPFQVCLIYGFDRRGPRHGCFTLRDGQLAERPYYVIESFDPELYVAGCIGPA
ncbi:MAG TPA: hypothetical protein P5159_14010 [Phycisphaerae bacterium]|nr:hypothetical protein [Phycisphaerae bacterium]